MYIYTHTMVVAAEKRIYTSEHACVLYTQSNVNDKFKLISMEVNVNNCFILNTSIQIHVIITELVATYMHIPFSNPRFSICKK